MALREPLSAHPATGAQAALRVRLGPRDAHYGGELVAGARILELFGDLATELCIRLDGDEGLLRAYSNIEFLVAVRAGDFLEARGRIIAVNRTSRTCEFEAYKVIAIDRASDPGRAAVLSEPALVAKARGTVVTTAGFAPAHTSGTSKRRRPLTEGDGGAP